LERDSNLKLVPTSIAATHWVNFHDQFEPKSPWHDRRVRLAAAQAIDGRPLHQPETLGFSRPTGGILPKEFEFSLPLEPYRYDPARARQLLAEAGYPSGFDAGEFSVGPPYFSVGETIIGYLQAVGLRARLRTMERAAFFSAWRDRKIRGLSYGASGAHGNVATRMESFVVSGAPYTNGGYPDIDELMRAQARELDRGKREELLHQAQRLVYERVMFAPLWQYTFLNATGPAVADARFGAIASFPYTAPYEEIRLRRPCGGLLLSRRGRRDRHALHRVLRDRLGDDARALDLLDERAEILRRGVAALRRPDRLLDRGELPIEQPRAGKLDDVHQEPWLQPGQRVHLLADEQVERGVDALRPYQLGVLDVAAQPELVGALVRHGDADALAIHVGDGADRRSGRNEIRRGDLEIGRGERDLVRALRLGAEEGDVPGARLDGVGQLAGRGEGAEVARHADPPPELARKVGRRTARLGPQSVGRDEQEVPIVDADAELSSRSQLGPHGRSDVVGHSEGR